MDKTTLQIAILRQAKVDNLEASEPTDRNPERPEQKTPNPTNPILVHLIIPHMINLI